MAKWYIYGKYYGENTSYDSSVVVSAMKPNWSRNIMDVTVLTLIYFISIESVQQSTLNFNLIVHTFTGFCMLARLLNNDMVECVMWGLSPEIRFTSF